MNEQQKIQVIKRYIRTNGLDAYMKSFKEYLATQDLTAEERFNEYYNARENALSIYNSVDDSESCIKVTIPNKF